MEIGETIIKEHRAKVLEHAIMIGFKYIKHTKSRGIVLVKSIEKGQKTYSYEEDIGYDEIKDCIISREGDTGLSTFKLFTSIADMKRFEEEFETRVIRFATRIIDEYKEKELAKYHKRYKEKRLVNRDENIGEEVIREYEKIKHRQINLFYGENLWCDDNGYCTLEVNGKIYNIGKLECGMEKTQLELFIEEFKKEAGIPSYIQPVRFYTTLKVGIKKDGSEKLKETKTFLFSIRGTKLYPVHVTSKTGSTGNTTVHHLTTEGILKAIKDSLYVMNYIILDIDDWCR